MEIVKVELLDVWLHLLEGLHKPGLRDRSAVDAESLGVSEQMGGCEEASLQSRQLEGFGDLHADGALAICACHMDVPVTKFVGGLKVLKDGSEVGQPLGGLEETWTELHETRDGFLVLQVDHP